MREAWIEKMSFGYGHPKQRPDVTILVPHHASFRDLQRTNLELSKKVLSAIEVDDDTFQKMLVIEQDVFAHQAAFLIGSEIQREIPWIKIDILRVLIPRAIVDMNRILRKAIWHVFDHKKHPDLYKELDRIHFSITGALREAVKYTNMVIDLHSMSPTEPWEKIKIEPGNIGAFIEAWRNNPEKRRTTDIITQKVDQTGRISRIGDTELVKTVHDELEKFNIPVKQNGTFQLNGDHLGSVWSSLAKSYINIDFTKDNGSRQQVEDEDFDLSELSYDEQRLNRFTIPFARGIVKVLKARSKR